MTNISRTTAARPLTAAKPAAKAPAQAAVAPKARAAPTVPTTTLGDARAFSAADGTQVAFRVTDAKTSNPDVVVVHVPGLGTNSHYMDEMGKQLAGENVKTYAIDNRGHGLTEGPKGDVADYKSWISDLDRLVDVAKQENPGKKVVVSGSSMGALVALRYAQTHQDKVAGVEAMSPVFLNTYFAPKHYLQLGKAIVSSLWDKHALDAKMDTPMNLDIPLTTNPEAVKMGQADPYLQKTVTARLYLNVLKMTTRNMLAAPFQKLPTFVATAGDDHANANFAVRGFQKLQGLFGHADKQLVNYEGAGHDLPEEWQRPEIAQDLAAFAKKVAK
jgi:alpha-beta hydrolase superfamily lysophospholipase